MAPAKKAAAVAKKAPKKATPTKVRLALIGAGGMANSVHYPSLKEMRDVEMAAICDLVPDKLQATADKFEIEKRYSNYRQMIEETAPDAVYVLMPPHHLFDIVIHVVSQKLHCYIEKPPGVTSEQTRQMANAAEDNGVIGMVAFNRRYIPLMRQCKAKVEASGAMNQVVSTFYKQHDGGPYYGGAIDILSCDAVHAVDALRFMGGGVVGCASAVRTLGKRFATSWTALVEFESGAVGVLLTNWQTGGRVHQFEMHSHGASAFIDPDDKAILHLNNKLAAETITAVEAAGGREEKYHSYGFFGENRHFIDCIQSGKQPETSFADAAKTMELVDLIYATSIM
ncbi:Gfo/Idh/MocA family oxidoreductase [bacterium]|nr:Gfo/Idh/MocA family oxidoreductase [bacterium]